MLTKASGSFSSPGYPQAYPRDTECEWYISTAPGTRIQITIHEFDIEHAAACVFDTLHVSEEKGLLQGVYLLQAALFICFLVLEI